MEASDFSDTQQQMVTSAELDARKALKIPNDMPPAEIVATIHAFVAEQRDRWYRRGLRDDQKIALSAFYAASIVHAHGWEWQSFKTKDGVRIGVTDPDRKWVVLPTVMFKQLFKLGVDKAKVTPVGLFAAIGEGKLPDTLNGSLTVISDCKG